MDEDNSIQDETPKKGTRASEPVSAPKVSQEPAFSEVLSDVGSLSDVVPNEPARIHVGMTTRRNEPQRDQTPANLEWPPKKEDLERLYVQEHLSAMKISKLYGLRYPSPKSGEAMILYHLKHKGITRRPAAHIPRVTEEMVDAWVKRYEAGESLKQIAANEFSPVTVFLHLKKRGLQLRDKVEAQIKAVTKHPRTPFNGDPNLRAFLIGISKGDYWVTTHGRATRVRLGTTHPAMVRLFRELFGQYGPVYEYPKLATLTEFEWSLDCDLDKSFGFLADSSQPGPEIFANKDLFIHFLAGFFDAEGSIWYHRKVWTGSFEVSIANLNERLLRKIVETLSTLGFSAHIYRIRQRRATGIRGEIAEFIWRVQLWNQDEVTRFLKLIPLKHPEKTEKTRIALKYNLGTGPTERSDALAEWDRWKERIANEVAEYIEIARQLMNQKGRQPQ
jgi:hypothetical protein